MESEEGLFHPCSWFGVLSGEGEGEEERSIQLMKMGFFGLFELYSADLR